MELSLKECLVNKFSFLPNDLINIILEYLNIVKYRSGKYIDRINENDFRYVMLKNIPKPIKISDNQYYIALRKSGKRVIKFSITRIIEEKNVTIHIAENYIGSNGLIYFSVYKILIN